MPAVNQSRHCVSYSWRLRQSPSGQYIMPVAIHAELLNGGDWYGSGLETVVQRFGGEVRRRSGSSTRYGILYGVAEGWGAEALVYWDLAEGMATAYYGTWFLRQSFNEDKSRRWAFRMKRAEETDGNGRMVWRGWSPVVGFLVNTPPGMPEGIGMIET